MINPSPKKKILHLTLKREWFNAIATKEKTVEYRTIKPYWTTRLLGKTYDEIHFKNGYGAHVPFMRVEWKGMSTVAKDGEEKYAIKLGNILEIQNNN